MTQSDETASTATSPADAPSAEPEVIPGGLAHWPAYLGFAAFWVVVDHVVKWWAIGALMPSPANPIGQTIHVIPGFFALHYAENRGAAFSMFDGKVPLLALISAAAVVGMAYWWTRVPKEEFWGRTGLALVVSGAFGNLIDRVHRGYVVDMFLAYYKEWSWPVFNVADTAICVGVGILLLRSWKGRV